MNSVSIKDLELKYQGNSVLKNLNLDIHQGEFLVLLGSSGCGKSTLLNCIAGLLDVADGQIFIGGRNVTWAEPSERGIGMVFQSYALYPQMTVEKNLAFGLRMAGTAKDEIQRRVSKASEILQIEALLKRKPGELSGGQRQRVAIGRALVRDVDVFLFDEPLSNLDAKLRADLRIELKRLHQTLKNTMIYVTHDQVEALTLADRIAIMKDGAIQQLSTPHDIYHTPDNVFVAGFIGSPAMNMIKGSIHGERFTFADQSMDVSGYDYQSATSLAEMHEKPAILGIRPEHALVGEEAAGAKFKVQVTVDIVEPMGNETVVWAEFLGERFAIKTTVDMQFVSGQVLDVGFDMSVGHLFDANSEARI